MVPAPRSRPRPATVLVLDEFDEGLTKLDFTVEPADLDLRPGDLEVTGPLAVHLAVARSPQMLSVAGQVDATVRGECCRCLAPAQAAIRAELRFLLQPKQGSVAESEALGAEEDVDLVNPGAKEYDLAERLHDAVLLELPLRLYCRTDCRGLCPRCGQDLNAGDCDCTGDTIDPRWEALAQLRAAHDADPSGA